MTGTVVFTSGSTVLGTSTLTNGSASTATSTLPLGSNPITATYNGDTNNNTATATLTQTVNKTGPSVSLTSSVNPSNFNQSVTFTATVAAAATGTITFLDGSTTLGTGTINNGAASFNTSSLTPGIHPITASYGGDANYSAAVSTPLSQTVNKTTPTLPPPVVSTNNPTYGSPVTITETVPPGVSGPVTFSNGSAPIGTAPIVGGVATITISNLPLGSDPITASTPGDSTNNPATSPSVTVTVVKASPTVSVSSSLNPSVFNQPVTFTAIVPATATGTITFLDGSTTLGTGVLNSGQATLTTSTLVVGSHVITVTYSGDTNDSAATSLPLTQVVNKATPVIPPPVVSSSNPPVNTPVTITETVPPGVTGTVTFSNGTTPIGTAPIVGGVATITVSNLPVGADPITATTSGDSNNNPATSTPTVVTVTPATPVLVAPIVSSNNPPPNTPVTITEPIPAGVSGPIIIYNGSTVLGTAANRQWAGNIDCALPASRHKSNFGNRNQYSDKRNHHIALNHGNRGESDYCCYVEFLGEPRVAQPGCYLLGISTRGRNGFGNLPRWDNRSGCGCNQCCGSRDLHVLNVDDRISSDHCLVQWGL